MQQKPHAITGIRILDFSRILAGPFCTMMLADFGADVIKVERPGSGDDTRQWGPPYTGEYSAYYLSVNRNKRSITLNLKTTEGRDLARRLVQKADVLVENFKVGQMQQYGLDYATLAADNPGLIYCSLTGYGQDGPYATNPGYDYAIQAMSGLMAITGPEEGPPYKVGVAITDVIMGLYAANAIQAALHYRESSGQGQYIDISLLDSTIAALVNVASNYLVSGERPRRYGNGHPNIVPYQAFETADGTFVLACGNDSQFRATCDYICKSELAGDVRFATNPARVMNRAALIEILEPIFREKTTVEWIKGLLSVGVPASPVNEVPEVFADPHVQARGLVQQVRLADGQMVDMVGPTSRLSHTPPTIRRAPPALGQHTTEVLREWLDVDDAILADYAQCGIV